MQEQLKPFKTVEQIAKKHRLDVSFIEKQLKMGEPIEHEHTKDHKLAMEIALQHLDEIPDYYTRLKKMEADAKKHHKKFKDVKEETKSGDEGLHDWFGKSKSSDGKRGWVQLGGKYAGKPCARQPGQTSTPKCGSSKMAANLSPEEEERARRRKNRLDPNQPQKSGGAKPTNVRTEEWSDKYKRSINCNNPKGFSQRAHCQGRKKKMNEQSFQIDTAAHKSAQKQQKIRNLATGTSNPNEKSAALRKLSGPSLPLADEYINEVKDKPSKGSGTKDACYHKVKSRYDVWPSAYASGALVKCRKVGAANWGTKSEETVVDEAQKCWPGYKKKGTKKMFGKTYNNCVKESEEMRYCPLCKKSESKTECSFGPALWEKYSIARVHPANEEKDYEFQMARNQLQTAKRSIDKLMKKLKGEGNMEAWVQSKITKASDYLDSVSDYMEGDRDEIEESNLMKYNEYGQTYIIRFSWRGLMYKVQIFIPSLKKPSAQEIKTQLNKIYPGAMLLQFEPRENDPVDPTIVFAKEDREYRRMLAKERQAEKEKESKRGGQRSHTPGKKAASAGRDYASYQERSISAHDKATKGKHTIGNPFAEELVNEVAAWQRKEGKNPTGGLNRKGIESYRRENPGSKLSMAVTTPPSKLDPDSKAAKRRKSFCARMGGMPGPMKDEKGRPTRKALSLRKWNC